MLHLRHTPAPLLGEFIENLWFVADAPPHAQERILPSGTIELVINLRDDEIRIDNPEKPGHYKRFSGAVVSGAYSRFFVIDSAQHASIMGVHFRPGGALPFLGLPAGELADAHVDLETLWGRAAAELRERVCAARTPAERFGIMESALAARPSRLRRAPQPHAAVPAALAALAKPQSRPMIRDVASHLGLSQRRFIQVFAGEVGMTPKLFCRVRRFQHALSVLRQPGATDWARLALACGYFDQSHLIRDFLSFSGLSPTEYFRQRSDRVKDNHVPLAPPR